MSNRDQKPITPIVFTELELNDNNKIANNIIQSFLQQHPEITSPANSDLTKLLREEKQMYANMAIRFTVQALAADRKRKGQ